LKFIPEPILKKHKLQGRSSTQKRYLVKFYDNDGSWQWLPIRSLRAFGVDQVLDQDMLSSDSLMQFGGTGKGGKGKKGPHARLQIVAPVREAVEKAKKAIDPNAADEDEVDDGHEGDSDLTSLEDEEMEEHDS
jgi:hypothetical protein